MELTEVQEQIDDSNLFANNKSQDQIGKIFNPDAQYTDSHARKNEFKLDLSKLQTV